MPTPIVETLDLSKRYGEQIGLDALDLRVEAGEVLGFLGPNGAGKTTTIRLLLDLIRPTRGEAKLFGRSVRDPDVRRSVGYLPGELSLDERLSAHEMLVFLDSLRPPGTPPANPKRRQELCERLRLTAEDQARLLRNDSRGTKQKVGLIAALQHDPALLILDEPTTGLDPLAREATLELMREAGSEGRTVFHSSHVISEVDRSCSRVAIVRKGRLVTMESTESLRQSLTRRMVVRFKRAAPLTELAPVCSAILESDGPHVVLAVTGALDPLLAVLARHAVESMSFPEPDLDEAFLHHYVSPDEAPATTGPVP